MDKRLLDLGVEVEKARQQSNERYRPDNSVKKKVSELLNSGVSALHINYVTGIPKTTLLGWKDKAEVVDKSVEAFKEIQFKEEQTTQYFEASVKLNLSLEQLKLILTRC